MELKVNEIQALEPVQFNYEELKASLTQSLEKYKNLVYTEESIKEAKADRALLNKVITAINDEKKRIKNKLLEPYVDFENKLKELMSMVNEVVTGIDVQVKNFEEIEKQEKMQQIVECWNENVGEFRDLINIDLAFNNSWLNKTYTLKKVEADIQHMIAKTKTDFVTIDGQMKDEIINKQVKDFYLKNVGNASVLSLSLQEGVRIVEANQKLQELENSRKLTENTAKITNSSQNLTKTQENITKNENLKRIDFRFEGTIEQLTLLKNFCVQNNIKILRGITEEDVLDIVENIDTYVQDCRESGETDLRGILHYTQEMISSISKNGTRKTVQYLRNESEDK